MNIPLIIELNQVDIYNDDILILENVDFSLAQGEMSYIIGKSGSGKSSLLKTLYGAKQIMNGSGRVGEYNLAGLDRKSIPLLRRSIGMVFQDFNLFNSWSIRQNLEYVLKATDWKDKEEITKRALLVLNQVGLSDKSEEYVYNLSGGEQQRVVIARAILNHPKLIIADEPTGNLDPDTSDAIFRLLYEVATENKSAMLIATHDYRIIEKFPAKVYVCEDKKIIERL